MIVSGESYLFGSGGYVKISDLYEESTFHSMFVLCSDISGRIYMNFTNIGLKKLEVADYQKSQNIGKFIVIKPNTIINRQTRGGETVESADTTHLATGNGWKIAKLFDKLENVLWFNGATNSVERRTLDKKNLSSGTTDNVYNIVGIPIGIVIDGWIFYPSSKSSILAKSNDMKFNSGRFTAAFNGDLAPIANQELVLRERLQSGGSVDLESLKSVGLLDRKNSVISRGETPTTLTEEETSEGTIEETGEEYSGDDNPEEISGTASEDYNYSTSADDLQDGITVEDSESGDITNLVDSGELLRDREDSSRDEERSGMDLEF